MKKLAGVLAPMAFVLTACVTADGAGSTAGNTANGLAMTAVKVGVQAKCVTEINNNTYWKTASKIMTETQQSELQTEVCSCVAEKATTSVTVADLAVAAMDKTTQATLATKIVANSLNACVVEVLKK